mgnify:FL=1
MIGTFGFGSRCGDSRDIFNEEFRCLMYLQMVR